LQLTDRRRGEGLSGPSTGASVIFESFTATAIAGPAEVVTARAGNGQSGEPLLPLASPLTAYVAARYGNAVAGVPVTSEPAPDNGSAPGR